jgi:hypothetical protein
MAMDGWVIYIIDVISTQAGKQEDHHRYLIVFKGNYIGDD